MSTNKKQLKDYLYMDEERIRSFVAQLNGGLIDNYTSSTSDTTNVDGSVSAKGLAKLLVDANVGAGYLYQSSSSETLSLHHAMFDILLSDLAEEKLISSDINDDCPFVIITTNLKCTDYQQYCDQIESAIDAQDLMEKFTSSTQTVPPKAKTKKSASSEKLIADVMRKIFGNLILLELFEDDGDLIATADLSQSLKKGEASLFLDNNAVLRGKWTVVAVKQQQNTNAVPPTSSSNIDIPLDQISDVLNLMKVQLSPDENLPKLIPIAIYQEL